MDKEARLARALAAAAPPARDLGFLFAVMAEAERQRFRAEAGASVLRGAGLVAAVAALAVPLGSWAASHTAAFQAAIVPAGGLIVLVVMTRIMTQRAAAAWGR